MNVGQIKAFLGDQKSSVHPDAALKKQLQEEGLRQAAAFQESQAASVSVVSSQTSIGLRVFSNAMGQSVTLDGKKAKIDAPKSEDKNASLFDFEKVARNVMNFVGGVIQGAADGGADEAKLTSLFGQARAGVAKGIALAKKDLGGLMNDEISSGIKKSEDLIEDRLTRLEDKLLGKKDDATGEVNALGVSASDSQSGSLVIRTRDGDEVTLRFESLRQFQLRQQTVYSQQLASQSQATDQNNTGNTPATQAQTQTSTQSLLAQFFEKHGISFSLQGELDDGEMKAIADLVGAAGDLADTFFGGNLDKAFEQALKLGYDDKELTGYALQLNRTQKVEIVQAYESIQHYKDSDKQDASGHGNQVSPIAQYLDKMLNVMNLSGEALQDGKQYNNLISGLLNEMKEVQVPDLVSAINRFHSFNNRLLNALPSKETTGA